MVITVFTYHDLASLPIRPRRSPSQPFPELTRDRSATGQVLESPGCFNTLQGHQSLR